MTGTVRDNLKSFFQPAFLICAAVLALAAAATSSPVIESVGMFLRKEPVPLKKSLDLLDEHGLYPFVVEPQNKLKIENAEIVRELGTEDYIQWILEDTSVPPGSPVRKCFLFITYYGSPDKVPHVPEECYAGAGFQRITKTSVELHTAKAETKQISAQYLVFNAEKGDIWENQVSFPVLYFFRVNGEYASSREEVRIALNKNLFRKSSYFSKIELAFNQTAEAPGKQETIRACESILNVILPVLEKEYWPEWQN